MPRLLGPLSDVCVTQRSESAAQVRHLEIATRYLGPDGAKAHLEVSSDDIQVALTSQRWRTVDFAKLPNAGS